MDVNSQSTIFIISVESFTAMNMIYNIDSSSNTLEVALYSLSGELNTTIITVNPGACDIYTLVDTLNKAFNNKYLVTFDSITGFVTLSPQVLTTNYAFFIITTRYTGLLRKLGVD